jgi:hypothetical protein
VHRKDFIRGEVLRELETDQLQVWLLALFRNWFGLWKLCVGCLNAFRGWSFFIRLLVLNLLLFECSGCTDENDDGAGATFSPSQIMNALSIVYPQLWLAEVNEHYYTGSVDILAGAKLCHFSPC